MEAGRAGRRLGHQSRRAMGPGAVGCDTQGRDDDGSDQVGGSEAGGSERPDSGWILNVEVPRCAARFFLGIGPAP